MRNASPALIALLNSNVEYRVADLLTIVQPDGTTTRSTSADIPITCVSQLDNASHTFPSSAPKFTRGTAKLVIGIEVDSMQLTILPDNAVDTLNGILWPAAVDQGALDEAFILVERAYVTTWNDFTAGTLMVFGGRVGEINNFRNAIQIEIVSDLELLGDTLMPRNVYQPGCLHTLFDAGCGLDRTAFEVTGTVGTGSDLLKIKAALTQASGYFDLGTIRFTSGANTGKGRAVKLWTNGSPGTIELMRPLQVGVAPGDTFTITPGCDKAITPSAPLLHAGDIRFGTCQAKFSNVANARAFPFVPTPENAI